MVVTKDTPHMTQLNKMLSLSHKHHRCHSAVDMFKVCCAGCFWFSS